MYFGFSATSSSLAQQKTDGSTVSIASFYVVCQI